MWNVGFLILILLVAVGSYQLMKREGMEGGEQDVGPKVEKIKNGSGVIFFTMKGCGWCDKIKPALEKLSKSDVKDHFAWVHKGDDSSNDALLQEFNVTSYPTILTFKNGTAVPYNDSDREFDKLHALIKETVGM